LWRSRTLRPETAQDGARTGRRPRSMDEDVRSTDRLTTGLALRFSRAVATPAPDGRTSRLLGERGRGWPPDRRQARPRRRRLLSDGPRQPRSGRSAGTALTRSRGRALQGGPHGLSVSPRLLRRCARIPEPPLDPQLHGGRAGPVSPVRRDSSNEPTPTDCVQALLGFEPSASDADSDRFKIFEIGRKIVVPETYVRFDTPKITLHLGHSDFTTVQRERTGLTTRGQPGGHRIAKA
jgi:hypothetical protein